MNTELKKALRADAYKALRALGQLDDGPHEYGLARWCPHLHNSIFDAMAGLSILIAQLTEQIGTDNL